MSGSKARARAVLAVSLWCLLATSASAQAPVAAPAQPPAAPAALPAGCPTTATSTIVTRMADGRTREHVRLDGDRVAVTDIDNKGTKSTTVRFRGLLPLSFEGPNGKSTITYTADLAGIFPLQLAKEERFAQKIQVEGQAEAAATMVVLVLAREAVKIGACSYDVLRVGRQTEFAEPGRKTPITHDLYAPSLGIVLRTTLLDQNGTDELPSPRWEFDSIVAR